MREMKDSGVAWIGEIPKDWDLSRLKFSSTYNDESIKEDTNPEKEIEYVEIGSVTLENGVEKAEVMRFKDAPSRARRIARKGDIIISTVRTYLKAIALIEKDSYTVSTGFCVIRPQKCMDSGYLKYFCSSELFTSEVSACSVGISYPAINASTLMDFHIINPPLAVQHKIVRVLDEKCNHVDSLIANVQAQIEKLKAYKQSLITEVVTKGLDPNAPMKDSELPWFGLIPQHWKLAKIKMYATTCSGGTPPSGDMSYYNGKINWVCSYDLCEKEIEETEKTLSDKGAEHIAGTLQLPNSILVAMYGGAGTIGNSGLLKCYARTNQAICSIHFDEAVVEPKFAFYQTMFIRRYWMFFAVGTRKDPNISQDIVRNMKYVIPPIQEQTAIATYLDAKCSQIDQLITLKESKIEKLQQYKRSLIYEYVTGKKEVV